MAERNVVEPDLGFIKEVSGLGGSDLKKCYQCATCSVVCTISPENKPFPRKEMIAASWGLKDKLMSNEDVWLCHNCGDCTTQCPRSAKPGEVLAAVRSYAISEYATPRKLGKLVNNPRGWPVLVGIPVVYMLVLGLLLKAFGVNWLNFSPGGDTIVHAHFFSTWLVDLVFIPLSLWVVAVFALGLKRFIGDMHANALMDGKSDKEKLDAGGMITSLIKVIPTILKHSKFNECNENQDRSTAHLLVLYAFVGLFIVTGVFFLALYVFQQHGPYSQLNPVKWLANISGVALVVGSILLIKNRRSKTDQGSNYTDWYLLWLIFALAVSGMFTEITRLAGWAGVSYTLYFIHLVCVFMLFAFLPFSKLAHLVYRTVAMAYADYSNRGF